ncbi:translation initiation factor IF-2-like [Rhipicephalus sanguineus]|uniref:translation initiation factor IF-2-like n=1 Tax=Rhipicephalus sanguineus TaxID=34632 RepID=UPI0018955DF9|nr:translation initiation factor IF-2-like [Rhipicephalus sanguineus]
MAIKKAEGTTDPPKAAERAKRQAAVAGSGACPSNEAPAPKRPRGRPPKAVSVAPLAPKPVATTAARKLRKAAKATQPESENPSTSKAVATKAPGVSRRKRSGSSSPSNANDTAGEAPRRRSAKPCKLDHTFGKKPWKKEEAQQEPPPGPLQKFFLGDERALEARQEASPCP